MTPEKTKEAFRIIAGIIRNHTRSECLKPERLSLDGMKGKASQIVPVSVYNHLLFMTEEGQRLVDAGRIEKSMRWLGFLQGALYGLDMTSIEEQKNINRPDDVAYDSKRI
jgi:hypothetical protein